MRDCPETSDTWLKNFILFFTPTIDLEPFIFMRVCEQSIIVSQVDSEQIDNVALLVQSLPLRLLQALQILYNL